MEIGNPKGFTGLMELMVVFLQITYVIYAFILTKQVRLMNLSFKTPFASGFSLLAKVHFIASILLVFYSIIIL